MLIKIYWCRWQCAVYMFRVALKTQAGSCGFLCYQSSEWIQIITGVPQGSALGPLLFILYTSKMFQQWRTDYIAYADDTTLLSVVHKPADRPAVAASLNRGLPRIQEWCNHWCTIVNPNKTMALVVNRSRTLNPPGDLVLPGVSIVLVPTLTSLGVMFDSKLIFKDNVHGIVSSVFHIIELIFWDWWSMFLWTALLLHVWYAFVLPILDVGLQCGGQLLNVIFSVSSARCIRWPSFPLIRVSCHCVIDIMLLDCML